MSTHAIRTLIPVGIVRFSRFITVQVENYFGATRNISYVEGTGVEGDVGGGELGGEDVEGMGVKRDVGGGELGGEDV